MLIQKNLTILLIIACLAPIIAQTRQADSLRMKRGIPLHEIIIPAALIGTGIFGLESPVLRDLNTQLKTEVGEHIDRKVTIDDFSQYAPSASVYILNTIGVQGKHRFGERTLLLAASYAIMGGTVAIVKKSSNVVRPDGSASNSFPSGHTATAFASAEFLRQEYRNVSIWYGIAGYTAATATGLFRIYNDRHWLNDVIMGAGIGILSTRIVYWIYPLLSPHEKDTHIGVTFIAVPFYNGNETGANLVLRF